MKRVLSIGILVCLTFNMMAANFRVGGINYYVTSDNTVGVCRDSMLYKNDIAIPSTVSYMSKDYTVKSIRDSAFYKCVDLTSISIPSSVTTIGSKAFFSCSSLKSIPNTNNVDSIGLYAFYKCTSLKTVEVSNPNARIGQQAFYLCTGLNTASINAKYLGAGAFGACSALMSVTLGNSPAIIGEDVFMDCISLAGIKVDETNPFLADIDGVLFTKDRKTILVYPNAKGENYIIPEGVDSIANCAFETCPALKTLSIPESITAIGESAFYGDISLNSLVLPPHLSFIKSLTFKGCIGLSSIVIPDSVMGIGDQAFADCENLISVQFSASVSTISNSAFWDCAKLTTIYVKSVTPPSLSANTFSAIYKSSRILYVPIGSKDSYLVDPKWKTFSTILEKDFQVSISRIMQPQFVFCTGNGYVDIKSDQSTSISFYSVWGIEVYKTKLTIGDNHICMAPGLYLMKCNNQSTKVLIR